MKLFMITRTGNTVQNEVSTMLISARNEEIARNMALKWEGSKKGFESDKINVTEVPLAEEQIILIQSL